MSVSTAFVVLAAIPFFGTSLADVPDAPFGLCTSQECDNCPNSVTSAGTGFPACVVYDRDDVLGGYADDYETVGSGKKSIFYDIAEQEDTQCRTIIRSPANVDDEQCGAPVYVGKGGVCVEIATDNTFMVQFCCGTDDCHAAGANKREVGTENTMTGMFLQDKHGNYLIPNAAGHKGVDLTDTVRSMLTLNNTKSRSKRDCDKYNPNGAPFTRAGTDTISLGSQICGDGTEQTVTNEHSVSQTTTFGSSVGDPFGIISASIEFSFEESASQSYSYKFTPPGESCGHVTWTPIYECTKGTITGCDGGDQTGDACTAKRISKDQLDGAYRFTITDG